MTTATDAKCLHCRWRKRNRPRGLCFHCFQDTAIRARYPTTSKFARRGESQDGPVCWACGDKPSQLTHLGKIGWHTRKVRIESQPCNETYCHACWSIWGWPVPMSERLQGVA